jgi:uncharacterized protein YcfL
MQLLARVYEMKRIITVLLIVLLMAGCSPSEPVNTEVSSPATAPSESVSAGTSAPDIALKLQQPQSVSEQVTETADISDSDSNTTKEIETDPYGNHLFQYDDTGKFPLFPLYAMIPTESIYLYGVFPDDGMILYQNGRGTYLNWGGPDRFALPQLLYQDFDYDGKKELAVTIFTGHGTGIAVMDLHVLKIEDNNENQDKPIYSDYLLSSKNVHEWLPITANLMVKNKLILDIHGESYTFENEEMLDLTFIDITYGDLVYFSIEDSRIRTEIRIGAFFEEFIIPWYFGRVEATVIFDGEGFRLEDCVYTTDAELNPETD